MALTNQPYFPFYVDDYIGDEKLNQCDPTSQGLYIRLLCVMHKSPDYGKIELTPFDKAKLKQNLSKIETRQDQKEIIDYLGLNYNDFLYISYKVKAIILWDISVIFSSLLDLIGNDVVQFSGTVLSQKRMVRDGEKSRIRAEVGAIGGRANNDKLSKRKAKGKAKGKQKAVNGSDIETEIDYKYTFENVWNIYDKKINKSKGLESKWNELTKEEKDKALIHIPKYVLSTPDKQYRKHFETYLNKKSFNDEILGYEEPEEIKLGKQNNSLSDEELAKYASI